ncbi:hypothetical protein NB725_004077 [Pantoea ananatis]|nr:hypothetical protein [Pantoea ananatis]MCW0341318.1 hypothetical protein [Pantoea ananatis]MCW0359801.1 hypothetical protein [Pantoea ananatis]MCW0364467.1 hypothetical protein [Pantoea ananatis]
MSALKIAGIDLAKTNFYLFIINRPDIRKQTCHFHRNCSLAIRVKTIYVTYRPN